MDSFEYLIHQNFELRQSYFNSIAFENSIKINTEYNLIRWNSNYFNWVNIIFPNPDIQRD